MTYVDEDGNFITDYSEQSEDIITDTNNNVDTSGVDATQEIQENEIQDSEDKDFFKDVIKMLIQDKTSDSPDDLETTDTEQNSDMVPELAPDPQHELEEDVSSGNAIDYSGLLGDIIAKEDNLIENQEYLIAVSDDNKINSTLESQSATNVLLMIVIVILLVDLLVHFIRGLF